jgi:hypothetical protein
MEGILQKSLKKNVKETKNEGRQCGNPGCVIVFCSCVERVLYDYVGKYAKSQGIFRTFGSEGGRG